MTRPLRIMSVALFLWGLGEGMFYYLLPLNLSYMGATPVQIGAYLGAAGVVVSLCHIPAGILSDTIGSKQVMVAAWCAGLLACWTMFLANELSVFVLGILLYHLSGAVMAPMSSYIAAARGSWSMARALTTITALYSAGLIIGPILGGQVAERLGFRIIYGIAAALFTLSTILVTQIPRQPTSPSEEGSSYRRLLANAKLRRLLPLVFLCMFAMYLSWPLTPNFLQEQKSISIGTIGLFGSFNALGVVFLNLILGRRHPRAGFLLAQAVVAGSALLLWRTGAVPWFALAYFLAGGFRTARSLVTAQVDEMVSRADMGMAYGVAETVTSSVLILAPPIAGVLYSIQPWSPYPVSIGLLAISMFLYRNFNPRVRPELAVATAVKEGEAI